jgi:predicted AAA+ superfamily ATPase
MLDKLKEIILDFQESSLKTGVERHTQIEVIPGKATVCMGVRRGGKSTLMFQLMARLHLDRVSRHNVLHVNFFDDRLHGLQHATLDVLLEAYFSLYPEKKKEEKVYFFFDEIQVVPGWESFVDRVMRTENCEVYITGSSAHMLSKEIATQMRGRSLSWEVFPFSFREFLDLQGIDSRAPLSSKKRVTLQHAFGAYWEAGGFPEVAGSDKRLRVKIHQEYFQAMLFRDLVERHDLSHPKAISDLAHRLFNTIGSLYSINKLTGYLKSLGHNVSKTLVSDYLTWFEDAYILFTVRIFDASLSRVNANPKKIYCIDHAMVASVDSGILVNSGHLLENLVFITLRRLRVPIFYFKTKMGKEIDFIVQQHNRAYMLVQVCERMVDEQTKKREITALREAMSEMGVSNAWIVTRAEDDTLQVPEGTLHVVSVWRFLLWMDGMDM